MTHRKLGMSCTVLALLAGTAQAQIVNGSFELPVTDSAWRSLGNGSAAIPGWTVFGSSAVDSVVLIQEILAGAAFGNALAQQDSQGVGGLQWLDLTGQGGFDTPNGGALGAGVSQILNGLVPGSTYSLSFDVGAIGLQGANSAAIQVSINGAALPSLYSSIGVDVAPAGPWANTWTSYALDFVAAAGPNVISFAGSSIGGATVSIGLDNVALVPEPQSYALLAAGLGIVGLVTRRRRRTA